MVVYRRVLSRLTARLQGRRVPVAAVEGVIASVTAGLVLIIALRLGDPDITLDPRDHVVWILVVGLAGAVAAQSLWGLAVLVDRRTAAPSPEG